MKSGNPRKELVLVREREYAIEGDYYNVIQNNDTLLLQFTNRETSPANLDGLFGFSAGFGH